MKEQKAKYFLNSTGHGRWIYLVLVDFIRRYDLMTCGIFPEIYIRLHSEKIKHSLSWALRETHKQSPNEEFSLWNSTNLGRPLGSRGNALPTKPPPPLFPPFHIDQWRNSQPVSQKSRQNVVPTLMPCLLASMPGVQNEATSTLSWSLWPLTPDWALGSSLLFPTVCGFPSPLFPIDASEFPAFPQTWPLHQLLPLDMVYWQGVCHHVVSPTTLGSMLSSREVTYVSGQKQRGPSWTFSIMCPSGRWLVSSVSKSY